jgi:glycosyltransferase involved in cell wall biosynthesis
MLNRTDAMRAVLVYKSDLLPLSETFIKEQVLALRRWRGVLVGMRRLHQLPLNGLDIRVLRPDQPSLLNRLGWTLTKSIGTVPRSAVKVLERDSASLMHAHFGHGAIEAWDFARALNIPMLVTLHGYDINISREWWEGGHGGEASLDYPARLLRLAKHPRVGLIAVSNAVRQRAIAYGIPNEKISVQYVGVDTRKFAPGGRPIAERENRVLFVGRLVEKKGCEYLIRAFAQVEQSVPDASLIIAGDGVLRGELSQLARQLGVRAHFRGALSSNEVAHELHLARAFCLPSVTAANGDAEGFGIVLLEAQASGVPVVTSAMGGASEGINAGVTGFAFRERDVDTLAARLVQLLTNDAIASSLALAGPGFVSQRFDLYRCTEALEALYDRTLAPIARSSIV